MSFNENYKKLVEITEKLRAAKEPDIDALVPMVQEATRAYEACKTRMHDVKKMLDEHFLEEKAD